MILTCFIWFAAIGGIVLLATRTNAQTIDEVRAAFVEGRFLEAAEMGEAVGTSGAYALATQSLTVYGHYVANEDERNDVLERAIKLGEEAVRADSTNHEAYYQLAHALGRYGQGVGMLTALRKGLGGRTRDLLEAALAIRPDSADVHAAIGGWHADIAKAGRIARFMYKAKRERAVFHFERALELAPESIVVLMEYAMRLPYLDREDGRARAAGLLTRVAALPARDAYEELVLRDVQEALAELEEGASG